MVFNVQMPLQPQHERPVWEALVPVSAVVLIFFAFVATMAMFPRQLGTATTTVQPRGDGLDPSDTVFSLPNLGSQLRCGPKQVLAGFIISSGRVEGGFCQDLDDIFQ